MTDWKYGTVLQNPFSTYQVMFIRRGEMSMFDAIVLRDPSAIYDRTMRFTKCSGGPTDAKEYRWIVLEAPHD